MARICTLASGSAGNSTYISTSGGDVLVDAGISCKALIRAIEQAGGDIAKLRAVAVTHTHIDHIRGLKPFLNKTKIPLVASKKTLEELIAYGCVPDGIPTIAADQDSPVFGDVAITYFKTSHDSEGSGGYIITLPDGKRTAVCTDLGIMTDDVRSHLLGCEAVLLESNHDIEMLRRGPYPANLKLRIMSEFGHLSNNACATELPALLKGGTTRIILGHLSQQNNTPILVASAARAALADIGAKDDVDYILTVAKPKTVGVTVF